MTFPNSNYTVSGSALIHNPAMNVKESAMTSMPAVVILPLCKNHHWILLTITKATGIITIHDSLNHNHSGKHYTDNYLQGIYRYYAKKHGEDLTLYKVIVEESQQQNDHYSCGVITMLNARALVYGKQRRYKAFDAERMVILWELLFGLMRY